MVALTMATLVVLAVARTWPPPALEVWFLPVGQGDATLLRLPSGHTVLVDTGGERGRHPGREVVVPLLRALAVRRLDLVVISHGDFDHAGELADIARVYPPRELWLGEAYAARPEVLSLTERLRAGGTVVRVLGGGERRAFRLGSTALVLLHPLPPDARRRYPDMTENDNSLVLMVEDAGRRVLLAGDLEQAGEAPLLERWGGRLRADLLKVPHHGSRTSSSAALLLEVMPRLAVFSVGPDNRFGFPHPEVAARYRRLGVGTLRTDRDGLVVVRLGREATSVWTGRLP
jgi:competence protein ComEC